MILDQDVGRLRNDSYERAKIRLVFALMLCEIVDRSRLEALRVGSAGMVKETGSRTARRFSDNFAQASAGNGASCQFVFLADSISDFLRQEESDFFGVRPLGYPTFQFLERFFRYFKAASLLKKVSQVVRQGNRDFSATQIH